jgi:hypothetical protein
MFSWPKRKKPQPSSHGTSTTTPLQSQSQTKIDDATIKKGFTTVISGYETKYKTHELIGKLLRDNTDYPENFAPLMYHDSTNPIYERLATIITDLKQDLEKYLKDRSENNLQIKLDDLKLDKESFKNLQDKLISKLTKASEENPENIDILRAKLFLNHYAMESYDLGMYGAEGPGGDALPEKIHIGIDREQAKSFVNTTMQLYNILSINGINLSNENFMQHKNEMHKRLLQSQAIMNKFKFDKTEVEFDKTKIETALSAVNNFFTTNHWELIAQECIVNQKNKRPMREEVFKELDKALKNNNDSSDFEKHRKNLQKHFDEEKDKRFGSEMGDHNHPYSPT